MPIASPVIARRPKADEAISLFRLLSRSLRSLLAMTVMVTMTLVTASSELTHIKCYRTQIQNASLTHN